MPKHPTPDPLFPAMPLACGDVDFRGNNYALRPQGTQDWLLTMTMAGQGRFDFGGERFLSKAGDVVLVRPGTPHDYGVNLRVGRWKNIWVHFLPRDEVLNWVQWPQIFPGHYHLNLPEPTRSDVWETLREMNRYHLGAMWRKSSLAMVALEKALLLCDGVNPKHAETQRDPRILKAVEEIHRNLKSDLGVADLAKVVNLSRSRFVEIFHTETGLPPREFIEKQRLLRASELLRFSAMTITQIAETTGFDSPFYFSQRFKKQYGKSPRDFRREPVKLTHPTG